MANEKIEKLWKEIEKLSDDDFDTLKKMIDERWWDMHFKFDEEAFKKLFEEEGN
jgi:hypothetical protein